MSTSARCARLLRVLRPLGLDPAVAYYAFVGPFRRPAAEGAYPYVATSGAGGLLLGLGLLVLFEGVSVHFVLLKAGPLAVWLHAAADLYAIVWLFAAFQAARLRPVLLSTDRLLVRTSLLWTASVPRASIATVQAIREMPLRNGRPEIGVLRATIGAEPGLRLDLREPVVARGPFGLQRTVTAIALHVDDPDALRAALVPLTGENRQDARGAR